MWVKHLPTREGFYFVKDPSGKTNNGKPFIFDVRYMSYEDELCCLSCGSDTYYPISYDIYEDLEWWNKPVVVPPIDDRARLKKGEL